MGEVTGSLKPSLTTVLQFIGDFKIGKNEDLKCRGRFWFNFSIPETF
tara:strand:- start:723 stop:863 length:141 start_codon:yes stop_codon:yes gene_type:complete